MRPTGSLYETHARQGRTASNLGMLTTTRLYLVGIDLPSGLLVTSISFVSSTTAAVLPTNQLFGLFNNAATPALLRGSADDTTTAWAANTAKTLALTSTYSTVRSGLFYLGILVVATTTPTLTGVSSSNATQMGLVPIMAGQSTSAVTALPDPAGAITVSANLPYAWVS